MRTWVEVSIGALRRNWIYVRSVVPAASAVCAVVKADAYGHGAVRCAQEFSSAGAPWLAVTSVEEGAKLRQAGLGNRILVLGGFYAEQTEALVGNNLTPAIWDAQQLRWLAAVARSHRTGSFPIHLKVETGMGRLGVTAEQLPGITAALAAAPEVQVEAVFSHLAASEAADPIASEQQRERLGALVEGRAWHLLNSEGALRFAWGGMMARVGLALYGYSAQAEPAAHGIGYGARHRTARPTRTATIGVGYADGYRRDFSPGASVLIRGQRAPVLGAISMDLTCVDVTDFPSPPALGDAVELLGPSLPA